MFDIVTLEPRLPGLPVALPPLEGCNLDRSALIPRGFRSAEEAMTHFRREHAPEVLPYYRRYYLRPGRDGRVAIRYAWSMRRPTTDMTVGVFDGNDLAAARILIGNQLQGAFMTPVRWELCEDRDGTEPIEVGRFDVWSLLQGVTGSDLERNAARGLMPNLDDWHRFDWGLYMDRTCPGCGTKVEVFAYAFDINSARCANCGIRPFLSHALGDMLRVRALGQVTGRTEVVCDDDALLHAVGWMSHVGASTSELHQEELPDGLTPHLVLNRMLRMSRALISDGSGGIMLAPHAIRGLDQDVFSLAKTAASVLSAAIESGGPFTQLHHHLAGLLQAVLHESRRRPSSGHAMP